MTTKTASSTESARPLAEPQTKADISTSPEHRSAPADPAPEEDESQIPGATRDELIRLAAYRRYMARAGSKGDAQQDWLDAEAEVDRLIPG